MGGGGAFGCGDTGSPWVRGKIGLEKNILDEKRISVFLEGIRGFGKKSLRGKDFIGYGLIAYRILDAKMEYQWQLENFGTLCVKGSFRLFSCNAPARLLCLSLEWVYPLEL